MRSCIARAAAPEGGGKNPDLTLYYLDADNGTLDPAFDAHILPIKFWCMAIWEQWIDSGTLTKAIRNVRCKLDGAKYPWSVTTGPVATLLNSLERIGWSLQSCDTMVDDRGRTLDLRLDPPIVVCRFAAESVRRWRFARVLHSFHGMDEFHERVELMPGRGTRLLCRDVLDMSRSIRLTREGRTAACKALPSWTSSHACMLASAVSGGQWPQARLASVKKFDVQDDRCQLCLSAPGTLAHRYECPVTRPLAGWVKPDIDSEQILAALPSAQRLCLKTRGIMACKLALDEQSAQATLVWHIPLPDDPPDDTVYYIDGSAMDADNKPLIRLGFAIAAVSPIGELLGVAYGCPPSWILDSAGAETWAFYTVISTCPTVPCVVTDCPGIVNTLRDGKCERPPIFACTHECGG